MSSWEANYLRALRIGYLSYLHTLYTTRGSQFCSVGAFLNQFALASGRCGAVECGWDWSGTQRSGSLKSRALSGGLRLFLLLAHHVQR